MTAILKPIAFLLIIVAAYLVKRAGLFRPRDYRVMQVVVFDFTLPASIIVSFATNPHHLSMLLISVFVANETMMEAGSVKSNTTTCMTR